MFLMYASVKLGCNLSEQMKSGTTSRNLTLQGYFHICLHTIKGTLEQVYYLFYRLEMLLYDVFHTDYEYGFWLQPSLSSLPRLHSRLFLLTWYRTDLIHLMHTHWMHSS